MKLDEITTREVTKSFARLKAEMPQVTRCFYDELLGEHPALRGMFPQDTTAQERKLASALGTVVALLNDPDQLQTVARELGRFHHERNVMPEHYEVACEVLLRVLARISGPEWNRTVHESWARALQVVSSEMLASEG